MYARSYPVGAAVGGGGEGALRMVQSEELLIPQNYHGELLRKRPSAENMEPDAPAVRQMTEPMPASAPNTPDSVPEASAPPVPPVPPAATAAPATSERATPERAKGGVLSGLAARLGGDHESLLLLAAAGLLLLGGKDGERSGLLDGDDLGLLMLLYLLLS